MFGDEQKWYKPLFSKQNILQICAKRTRSHTPNSSQCSPSSASGARKSRSKLPRLLTRGNYDMQIVKFLLSWCVFVLAIFIAISSLIVISESMKYNLNLVLPVIGSAVSIATCFALFPKTMKIIFSKFTNSAYVVAALSALLLTSFIITAFNSSRASLAFEQTPEGVRHKQVRQWEKEAEEASIHSKIENTNSDACASYRRAREICAPAGDFASCMSRIAPEKCPAEELNDRLKALDGSTRDFIDGVGR